MAKANVRLLKWVGEPAMLLADGWSVANWGYENHRTIAVVGFTFLSIRRENMPGLSRDYVWGKTKKGDTNGATWQDFVQPVDEVDSKLIMSFSHLSSQLIDVTDHANPEEVKHDPILFYQDPETGKYLRTR